MKVSLLATTPNAPQLLAFTKATRLKMTADGFDRYKDMTAEDLQGELDYMVNTIKSSWEFVDFTIMIEGVSRAFTHQFVRNRTGSYAQQTMRILDVSGFEYVTGPSILASDECKSYYDETMQILNQRYGKLIDMGAAIEDARGILPTNICTNIVAKFNLRSLSDMVASRASKRTQNEYREIMDAVVDAVVEANPWVVPFLRDAKSYALKEIESLLMDKYEGTGQEVRALKLVDQVRNAK